MNKYRFFIWMLILALLAGYVNTITVFGFDGTTVSHVTGLISKFAASVAAGDIKGCLEFVFVILAFFVGAVAAGIVTGERAFRLKKVYGFIILSIGILLVLPPFLPARISLLLLAFLMGLQNGMVVTFKGILIRSTHMTGNITDFGVYVGYAIRGNKEEKPLYGIVPAALLFGFTCGGILGILLYNAIKSYAFFAASAVYIILGIIYFFLVKAYGNKGSDGAEQ